MHSAQWLKQGLSCHHLALSPACAEVSTRPSGSPGRELREGWLGTTSRPCRGRAALGPPEPVAFRPADQAAVCTCRARAACAGLQGTHLLKNHA